MVCEKMRLWKEGRVQVPIVMGGGQGLWEEGRGYGGGQGLWEEGRGRGVNIYGLL